MRSSGKRLTRSEERRAALLRNLRTKLRLGKDEFAKAVGIEHALLHRFEAEKEPWPPSIVANCNAPLMEKLESAQRDVDEAAALVAEIAELAQG